MKPLMENRPSWFYRQSGVIPFRQVDGRLEVLLVNAGAEQGWSTIDDFREDEG